MDGLLDGGSDLAGLFRELSNADIGVGSSFDGFTLLRRLGAGGMGVVYEAQEHIPNRRVAIKLIPSDSLSQSSQRRLRFETDLLANLDHPNIARVLSAGTAINGVGQEIPYFAMELVDAARPITTFARDMSLGPRDRVSLFLAACRAVGYGHERGVIHRDLKPANILVGSDGTPRVIDFGIARVVTSELSCFVPTASLSNWLGTVEYMAPEQYPLTATEADTRSDVFSLGITLCELITGRRPHRTETLRGLLNGKISSDLSRVIAKSLAVPASLRYSSATEMSDDLSRWLRGDPVAAQGTSLRYIASRWLWRHRYAALTCLLILISSLLMIALRRSTAATAAASGDAMWNLYVGQMQAASLAVRSGRHAELPSHLSKGASELSGWDSLLLTAMGHDAELAFRWPTGVTALQFLKSPNRVVLGDQSGTVVSISLDKPSAPVTLLNLNSQVRDISTDDANEFIAVQSRDDVCTAFPIANPDLARSWRCNASAMLRDAPLLVLAQPGFLHVVDVEGGALTATHDVGEPTVPEKVVPSRARHSLLLLGRDRLALHVQINSHSVLRMMNGFGKIRDAAWLTSPELFLCISSINGPLYCDHGTTRAVESVIPVGWAEHIATSAAGDVAAFAGPIGDVVTLTPGVPESARRFTAHMGPITALALSPDGKLVATAGTDGWIRVFDRTRPTNTTPEIRDLGHRFLLTRLSEDGRTIVAVSEHGTVLHRSSADLSTTLSWRVPTFWPEAIDLSRDGQTCAVGCQNGDTWISADPTRSPWVVRGDRSLVAGVQLLDDGDALILSFSGLLRRVDPRTGAIRWTAQLDRCGSSMNRATRRLLDGEDGTMNILLAGNVDIAVTVRLRDGSIVDRLQRSILGVGGDVVSCTYLTHRQEWLVADDSNTLRRFTRRAAEGWTKTGEVVGVPAAFIVQSPDPRRLACLSRTGILTFVDLDRFTSIAALSTISSTVTGAQVIADGTLFITGMTGEVYMLTPASESTMVDSTAGAAVASSGS